MKVELWIQLTFVAVFQILMIVWATANVRILPTVSTMVCSASGVTVLLVGMELSVMSVGKT